MIQLSKEQNLIVKGDKNKNYKILACAGSGKTTTLIYRIEHLIKNLGCSA